ncbi:hypothetical protein [Kitasatospora sp. NPDC048538]
MTRWRTCWGSAHLLGQRHSRGLRTGVRSLTVYRPEHPATP